MAAAPWTTVADVYTIARKTVTEADVAAATAEIETLTGLIQSVERADMTDRDRHWLKLATSYQAAWMVENPDLFSREDVTSASQDGESASYRNPDAHILAPLARKALRRLSWRGLKLAAPGGATLPALGRRDVNSEAFDDRLPYTRL